MECILKNIIQSFDGSDYLTINNNTIIRLLKNDQYVIYEKSLYDCDGNLYTEPYIVNHLRKPFFIGDYITLKMSDYNGEYILL